MIVGRLSNDFSTTFEKLVDGFRMTFEQLFNNF